MGLVVHSLLLVPFYSWKHSHRRHHSNTGSLAKDEVGGISGGVVGELFVGQHFVRVRFTAAAATPIPHTGRVAKGAV